MYIWISTQKVSSAAKVCQYIIYCKYIKWTKEKVVFVSLHIRLYRTNIFSRLWLNRLIIINNVGLRKSFNITVNLFSTSLSVFHLLFTIPDKYYVGLGNSVFFLKLSAYRIYSNQGNNMNYYFQKFILIISNIKIPHKQ